MLSSLSDIPSFKLTDVDSSSSPRGLLRVGRRMAKRCWLDHSTINDERVFCQNSGGCGSTYIAALLRENGVDRTFHEKTPDLLQVGLDHYEKPLPQNRLVRLLRYTRHDAFFEANNRLFSLTRQLAVAFPNARFIHLYRDAADSIRGAMSKQNLPEYLASDTRFRGSLAGPHEGNLFERFCHHWANMNLRIHDDTRTVSATGFDVANLKFEDLVKGRVQPLEDSLGHILKTRTCQAVNVRPVRSDGRFPPYSEWTVDQKAAFDRICGPVMGMMNREF